MLFSTQHEQDHHQHCITMPVDVPLFSGSSALGSFRVETQAGEHMTRQSNGPVLRQGTHTHEARTGVDLQEREIEAHKQLS